MAEVVLNGIGKRFGATEVIRDLSLSVRDGELFAIVGPSGCGKSTLLHLIAGLEKPTKGRILFDREDVTAREPRARDIALVFQSYALYPHMTVAENLAFPLRVGRRRASLDRRRIEEEVHRVAKMLGLDQLLERRPRELSGGQRQRVALGRAIIRRPCVFLLDEPLSNLDAQLRADMRAELRRLHDELGTTMVYVTHDQSEAMTLADRLAVLDQGRLQQVGTPQDLYERPGNVFVASFIGIPGMNLLDARVEGGQALAGPIRVPLLSGAGRLSDGNRVRLGLRPEEVKVSGLGSAGEEAEPRTGSVTGIVRLVEATGGQIWVTAEVGRADGPTTIVGLGDRGFKGRPGERVAVSTAGASPHFFDIESGMAIRS